MTVRPPVTVIIPNYNGTILLARHLPSVLAAMAAYGPTASLLVVDDGSTDDSVTRLRQDFPAARILPLPRNGGFAAAVNTGVRAATTRLVLLLNNDVTLAPDFIAPLARHFTDPAVFAVCGQSRLVHRQQRNESVVRLEFRDGLLLPVQPLFEDAATAPAHTCTVLHAAGGFSLFDRYKFLQLGGLDPYYVIHEDIDFCLRAWERGWLVLYEPAAICQHESQTTMRSLHARARFELLDLRNKVVTTWQHLSSGALLAQHVFFILTRLLSERTRDDRPYTQAILAALPHLPAVLARRVAAPPPAMRERQLLVRTAQQSYQSGRAFERVLLIDPCGFQRGLNAGLGALAGALSAAGITWRVADANNFRIDRESLLNELAAGGYTAVGISVKTATRGAARRWARLVRRAAPAVTVVAGGPDVTLYPEDYAEETTIDFLVRGDGEVALPALLADRAAARAGKIAGVMVPGGAPATPALVANIAALPHPDFSWADPPLRRTAYPLVTSRGCPYNCIFCAVGDVCGRVWRPRPVSAIIDELRHARAADGLTEFIVVDDNCSLDRRRLLDLCRALAAELPGLRWSCGNGVRADTIDDETATALAQAGCVTVMLGIESSSESVFTGLRKGENLAAIRAAIATLQRAGIRTGGFFLIGLPGQRFADFQADLAFIRATRLDWAHFGFVVPYLGTELRRILDRQGIAIEPLDGAMHFEPGAQPLYALPGFSRSEQRRAFVTAYLTQGVFDYLIDPRWPAPLRAIRLWYLRQISSRQH